MNRPRASPGSAAATRRRAPLRYERAPFPWRFALYAAVILYLFCDLYWLGGPLARRLLPDAAEQARRAGWVARVYGHPITRTDLDGAVAATLFRSGHAPARLATLPDDDALGLRLRVLEQLVEDRILALWARDEPALVVDEAAVTRDLADLRAGFHDEAAFAAHLAAEGIDEDALRARLRARLRQLAWIEDAIAAAATVTDDEVAAFHAEHREVLAPLDESAAEIRAHLAGEKRAAAVATLREQLRARAATHIEYFYDNLTP